MQHLHRALKPLNPKVELSRTCEPLYSGPPLKTHELFKEYFYWSVLTKPGFPLDPSPSFHVLKITPIQQTCKSGPLTSPVALCSLSGHIWRLKGTVHAFGFTCGTHRDLVCRSNPSSHDSYNLQFR